MSKESTKNAIKGKRLHYVKKDALQIQRQKKGRKFVYLDSENQLVKDAKTLKRILALVLPPAWAEVRICVSPHGHLQAMGRDQRGRWQYRYHQEWQTLRNETKFHRMVEFAQRLPHIRKKIKKHLTAKLLTREKVLAAAVDILQRTNMRIGNEIYTRTNHSYGLTTLRTKHAKVKGTHVHFHFRAKSGKIRDIDFEDPILSQIVRKCQEIPGQELFCYRDTDGVVHEITSSDVNRYIADISGGHFTAKDFRTWCGTLRALELAKSQGPPAKLNDRGWRKRHLHVIRGTADYLGNTPSICEKYYIHPKIFTADRSLSLFSRRRSRRVAGLNKVECAVLTLIRDSA